MISVFFSVWNGFEKLDDARLVLWNLQCWWVHSNRNQEMYTWLMPKKQRVTCPIPPSLSFYFFSRDIILRSLTFWKCSIHKTTYNQPPDQERLFLNPTWPQARQRRWLGRRKCSSCRLSRTSPGRIWPSSCQKAFVFGNSSLIWIVFVLVIV